MHHLSKLVGTKTTDICNFTITAQQFKVTCACVDTNVTKYQIFSSQFTIV